MAPPTRRQRPVRTLLVLGILIFALLGTIAAGTKWSTASWTPNLALDLEGGTQIILTPVAENGEEVTSQTIAQAIDVIRQRVDSSGVAEAEITSQSGGKIVVALPGNPSEETLKLVETSAQMAFRPVLAIGNPTPTDTTPTPEPTESAAATDPAAPAPTPTPTAAAEEPSDVPSKAAPDSPSDIAYYVTPAVQAEFDALDCTDPSNLTGGVNGDPDKAFVTCGQDGSAKYILGPVEIEGARISSATSGLNQLPSGGQGNLWVVNIAFDNEGTTQFTDVTTRLQGLAASPPQNQFAMVLDGLVISAPSLDTGVIIADGKAEISGTFTRESAASLANQLNFGSLPLTFTVESKEQISATLGSEQLQKGLLAGLIGLGLVVLYSLLQYRALGLVTVASLIIAGALTYSIITLLSWTQGYRLSLPGVAGLIVAIGITADSFIVYFERIRDELREGRTLVAAVDRGWERARRTILASDAVNFLAAIVLYLLAVGSVRGFAFTLGLTTLIDVLVVFMFTHPLMQLIARTKFFGQGHRLSGLDPRRLGAPETRYVGRGRVVHGPRSSADEVVEDAPVDAEATPRVPVAVGGGTSGLTIAERRAAARAAEQKTGATDAPVDAPAQDAEPESGRTEGNEH
ncbi:protein translocase subunit SecD [Cellulomonas humilata]|uniref:Protein translocase subunit SecD n=1 Tax=Cellulomonas humilata TaxID=144055 RepID=A0A7Y6A0V8_9CELL|nr:protein translocase subunit SecD [Cellulomonas humilata]NUU17626.1 protein translocase subunit SecD [Cellulomonas humilata]